MLIAVSMFYNYNATDKQAAGIDLQTLVQNHSVRETLIAQSSHLTCRSANVRLVVGRPAHVTRAGVHTIVG